MRGGARSIRSPLPATTPFVVARIGAGSIFGDLKPRAHVNRFLRLSFGVWRHPSLPECICTAGLYSYPFGNDVDAYSTMPGSDRSDISFCYLNEPSLDLSNKIICEGQKPLLKRKFVVKRSTKEEKFQDSKVGGKKKSGSPVRATNLGVVLFFEEKNTYQEARSTLTCMVCVPGHQVSNDNQMSLELYKSVPSGGTLSPLVH